MIALKLQIPRNREKRQVMTKLFHPKMIQKAMKSSSLRGESPATGEAPTHHTGAEHRPAEAEDEEDRVPGARRLPRPHGGPVHGEAPLLPGLVPGGAGPEERRRGLGLQERPRGVDGLGEGSGGRPPPGRGQGERAQGPDDDDRWTAVAEQEAESKLVSDEGYHDAEYEAAKAARAGDQRPGSGHCPRCRTYSPGVQTAVKGYLTV